MEGTCDPHLRCALPPFTPHAHASPDALQACLPQPPWPHEEQSPNARGYESEREENEDVTVLATKNHVQTGKGSERLLHIRAQSLWKYGPNKCCLFFPKRMQLLRRYSATRFAYAPVSTAVFSDRRHTGHRGHRNPATCALVQG